MEEKSIITHLKVDSDKSMELFEKAIIKEGFIETLETNEYIRKVFFDDDRKGKFVKIYNKSSELINFDDICVVYKMQLDMGPLLDSIRILIFKELNLIVFLATYEDIVYFTYKLDFWMLLDYLKYFDNSNTVIKDFIYNKTLQILRQNMDMQFKYKDILAPEITEAANRVINELKN